MNVLCWNCRGLGNPQTVQSLQFLLKTEAPGLVFLMETKLDSKRMDGIRRKLGLVGGFYVNRVGLAGGLALLWPAGIQVNVQSYSVGHIDAFVEAGLGDHTWRFTGFYGNPDTLLRKDSWALLRRLAGCFQMPWLCAGDFNEILFCREKLGVLGRSQIQLDNFRHALEDTHLADMGFNGPLFTWSNNRVGAALVRERLDRGLANDAWQGLFPQAKVYPLACTSSDHLPLCIDLCGDKAQCEIRRDKHRIYRFEAMWLRNANCEQVVTENWGPSSTTDVKGLVSNISRVSSSLRQWDRNVFGCVKKQLTEKTNHLHRLLTRCGLSLAEAEEERTLRCEIDELFRTRIYFLGSACSSQLVKGWRP
ncbi:uncharacterized protein LOC114305372 [Camellia sinensis]|uniref:uncharacterized protein LOC114305372 n=1 Tax=Camellia sinensis TaxID=4442 RepID=UPI0010357597|nr:uncharacterized protein LOC114305372 [Camellia sinensis]